MEAFTWTGDLSVLEKVREEMTVDFRTLTLLIRGHKVKIGDSLLVENGKVIEFLIADERV